MQTKYFPVATALVIILNAVIFVIGILSGEQTQIIQNYGFIPNHIFNAYNYGDNNNAQENPLTSLQQSSELQSPASSSRSDSITRLFTSMFILASYILNNGNVVLIGASGAISGVFGIAAVAGNTRAYYWLVLQIVFAVIGSISALPIAFIAHVGGFIAGVFTTKVLVRLEQSRRKSRYFLQS